MIPVYLLYDEITKDYYIKPNIGVKMNDKEILYQSLVEIKKLMAKPRIFASFPSMPQEQLNKLQKELQDPNSSQTIWAFDCSL